MEFLNYGLDCLGVGAGGYQQIIFGMFMLGFYAFSAQSGNIKKFSEKFLQKKERGYPMLIDLKSNPFLFVGQRRRVVESTLASMSQQEKIAQLFCLITYTDDENYLSYLAKGLGVGGVMTRTMSLPELIAR